MSDAQWDDITFGGLTPPVKVWADPVPGKLYSAGVDTAEGLGHGDASCIQMIRTDNGEQVACYNERLPPDLIAVIAARMGRCYNGALLVVEANNHGIATLNALRQVGYKSLFRRRMINRVYQRITEEYGFKTTMSSKPMIVAQLDEAIRTAALIIHEEETFTELKGYVRDEKGHTNGSPFDDRVIALALAHHGRAFMHQREASDSGANDDYMSFNWWRRQGEEAEPGPLVVGRHARRGRGQPLRERWVLPQTGY
jgi:hypothetical protein